MPGDLRKDCFVKRACPIINKRWTCIVMICQHLSVWSHWSEEGLLILLHFQDGKHLRGSQSWNLWRGDECMRCSRCMDFSHGPSAGHAATCRSSAVLETWEAPIGSYDNPLKAEALKNHHPGTSKTIQTYTVQSYRCEPPDLQRPSWAAQRLRGIVACLWAEWCWALRLEPCETQPGALSPGSFSLEKNQRQSVLLSVISENL